MEVYGMRQEANFINFHQDFVRKRGIAHTLCRNNSKTQIKEEVKKLYCDLVVAGQFSEHTVSGRTQQKQKGSRIFNSKPKSSWIG